MHFRKCSCRQCRRGLHRGFGHCIAKVTRKKARRIVRDTIRKGNVEVEENLGSYITKKDMPI